MRSKWKGYFSGSLWKSAGELVRMRNEVMVVSNFGSRVIVYNGKKRVSLLIKRAMYGHKFGEYVFTKALGASIHSKGKKGGAPKAKKAK
jgi:ribosomal protein S19